jgi:hypothetical protein
MSKVSAVAKSTTAFGVLGAWLGGISSYVFEYWGSHGGMWSALLDAQTRPMAWPAVISNVRMAIIAGYPAALFAGLLLSALGLMLRGQLARRGLLVWPLLGGSAGALAAFALFGASYGIGHPVASGLAGPFLPCCFQDGCVPGSAPPTMGSRLQQRLRRLHDEEGHPCGYA